MRGLNPNQIAPISRLFSSSVIREMARKGRSPIFARLVSESGLVDSLAASQSVHAIFDTAFALLQKEGNRDEYIYKAALTRKILLGTHSLRSASMLTEFRVGRCKADLVILNGTATVYEVKSERDSLSRLEQQIIAYSKVFAQIYVVAGENHIDEVMRSVPKDVGVMRLNSRFQISRVRKAAGSPELTSPAAIFDSIRTVETRMILESCGVLVPAVPNTELSRVLRSLFVKLSPRSAHEGMVRVLKTTRNLLPLSDLVSKLPHSLRTAALSVPLRKLDHMRLVSAVNTPIEDAMAWA